MDLISHAFQQNSLIVYLFLDIAARSHMNISELGTSRLDEISENSARLRYRKICGIRICKF